MDPSREEMLDTIHEHAIDMANLTQILACCVLEHHKLTDHYITTLFHLCKGQRTLQALALRILEGDNPVP